MPESHHEHRGMPLWRARQRALPVGEKLDQIARLVRETREFERIKQLCKKFAASSNDSSARER